MTLKDLVTLACRKSPDFKKRLDYRIARVQKNPHKIKVDLEWLMPRLEEILGKEFVEEAAQQMIEMEERLQEEKKRLELSIKENIEAHAEPQLEVPKDGW